MWLRLEDNLLEAANRLIVEHETYRKSVYDENARRRRRSKGSPALLSVQEPSTWQIGPGFNPYLVRSRRKSIAHALTNKLRERTYTPRNPVGFSVPKTSGGLRTVNTFEIADEVISKLLLRSLSKKNESRLSSRAYAYRANLSAHDAIDHIRSEFRRENRIFIAEYDFSKFFDTVNHDYLLGAFDRLGIKRTPFEQYLIESFLTSQIPFHVDEEGNSETGPDARTSGIPQGTSVSLFLANVAGAELDRSLERLGVGFVRYADDTLIWNRDYGRVCEAVEVLHSTAKQIGSSVNPAKSPGVRLLIEADAANAEFNSTHTIDYLGHALTLDKVRMGASAVQRIKRRVNHLLYTNLLMEPLKNTQAASRLEGIDRDYLIFVTQLRRYLYGPLSETQLRRFQDGFVPPMSFEGIMSFFPLLDDDAQLAELDSWLASQTWLAMRKRARLLREDGYQLPPPHDLDRDSLVRYQSRSSGGSKLDLRLPSFYRIISVIRSAVVTYGLNIASGGSSLYLYQDL